MALIPIAMDFGNGIRATDVGFGCISFAQAPLSDLFDDAAGPLFTVTYRFRFSTLSYGVLSAGECRVARANSSGAQVGWSLAARQFSGVGLLIAQVLSDACGLLVQHSFPRAVDLREHSATWSYDQAGRSVLYYDGVAVEDIAALCADMSSPAVGTDGLAIFAGNAAFAGAFVDMDEIGWQPLIATPAQVWDWHTNGLVNA